MACVIWLRFVVIATETVIGVLVMVTAARGGAF